MNAEHMIDYVLGRLEGPDREHLEAVLHSDPEAADRVQSLSRAVYLLLDDGDEVPHPAGLAERTIAMVARSRNRPRSILDYVPVRVPFRWADFAVQSLLRASAYALARASS